MTKADEARIRREGFPLTPRDAHALLCFIDVFDKDHMAIEPEIVVKLELLVKNWWRK